MGFETEERGGLAKLLGHTSRLRRPDGWGHVIRVPGLRFTALGGKDRHREWIVGHVTVRIGTHPDNDVVLADPSVSRFHAEVTRLEQGVRLKDLGSTNGTAMKGSRVMDAFLSPGDEFMVGQTTLRIETSESQLTTVPADDARLAPFVGRSAALKETVSLLRAAAPSIVSVMLLGESGTGKELAARYLHEQSGRSGPFVAFDCGRTHPDLVQAELFGHLRGAFTGATHDREGAFRQAHRGTLFLDELGELPLGQQTYLLRALETREVQSLGADKPVPVDARIVTATNRDLARMVTTGAFREDLYYRLGVVAVNLPPLRDRPEDVPLLVEHFVKSSGAPLRFSPAAMERLQADPWPGNVRRLRNAIERLGVTCAHREVTPEDLRFLDAGATDLPRAPASLKGQVDDVERKTILDAYERCDRNKLRTAKALGISRNRLKRKLLEFLGDEGE